MYWIEFGYNVLSNLLSLKSTIVAFYTWRRQLQSQLSDLKSKDKDQMLNSNLFAIGSALERAGNLVNKLPEKETALFTSIASNLDWKSLSNTWNECKIECKWQRWTFILLFELIFFLSSTLFLFWSSRMKGTRKQLTREKEKRFSWRGEFIYRKEREREREREKERKNQIVSHWFK